MVYKSLDNIGAFERWLGFEPNTKVATLVFGLFHGFGLSTKIIEYDISADGLIPESVGVQCGRRNRTATVRLARSLIVMGYWRGTASFWRHAYTANVMTMCAGFVLTGLQLTGHFVS